MNFRIAYMKIESFVILGGPAGGSRTLTGAFAQEGYHMTRRAFLSSKSNTGTREIEIKHACQKLV